MKFVNYMLLGILSLQMYCSDIPEYKNPFENPNVLWHTAWPCAEKSLSGYPSNLFSIGWSDVPYFTRMIRITERVNNHRNIYWFFLLKDRTIRFESLLVGPDVYVHGPTITFKNENFYFDFLGEINHITPDENTKCITIYVSEYVNRIKNKEWLKGRFNINNLYLKALAMAHTLLEKTACPEEPMEQD